MARSSAPQFGRVGDGCKMLPPVWRQRSLEVTSDVPPYPSCGDAIAPHLSGQHQTPVCCLYCATFFDLSQGGQQLHGLYIDQSAFAQPRKQIAFELAKRSRGMALAPNWTLFGVPFQRGHLKRVSLRVGRLELFNLAGLYQINPSGLLVLSGIPGPAGSRQGNRWIATQSELLFLIVDPVLEKPALGAVRADLQVEPSRITETRLLALWGTYGVAALKVSQHGDTKRRMKVAGGGTDPYGEPFCRGKWGYKNRFHQISRFAPPLVPTFAWLGMDACRRPWTASR